MALGIHLDNKQTRFHIQAAGMGVFLDMETQRKFMKTMSNTELQRRLALLESYNENLLLSNDKAWKYACERGEAFERMRELAESADVVGLQEDVLELRRENERLKGQVEEQGQVIYNYSQNCSRSGETRIAT